jgi:uroporphyrinogen decarboxylase
LGFTLAEWEYTNLGKKTGIRNDSSRLRDLAFVPAYQELEENEPLRTMHHRDRVTAALRHTPVDRVPIWMWYHPATSSRLAQALEISPAQLTAVLGDDIRQTWVGNNHAMEGIVHDREGDSHLDFWGVEWVREGYFNQVRYSPLAGADETAVKTYTFPYDHTDALMANMYPVMAAREDYFVGCDISPCLLELLFRIRGMEDTLFDLAASPDLAAALLDKAADFGVHLGEEVCRRFALDWLWAGDDVGGQQAMIVSPQQWRELIKPRLARIVAVGRKHGLPVAYHSCGAIRPIIPDLIEIGVNVLNPIQCGCPGMRPAELKREYGQSLAFMGGVDTQDLLPHAGADEVYDATKELVDDMTADGGGFILAASHSVPPETPVENIFAMYAAAGESHEAIFDRAATLRAGH